VYRHLPTDAVSPSRPVDLSINSVTGHRETVGCHLFMLQPRLKHVICSSSRLSMKKPLFSAALCLLLVAPSLSMAGGDAWRGHSSHGYSGQYRVQGGHGGYGGGHAYGHDHRHGHGERGRAWVPWVSVAVIGSSLYWANQAYSQPSVTVILEAPRVAYFCQTSRQYYPNVATCNMPWQLVSY
jgi:hypothetical protein